MNTSKLKSFAPKVRTQMMEAVERKLDYVLGTDTPDLRGRELQVAALRREAEKNRKALIERVASTWFNRLAALRFIDARGWHPFKARVLTPATPDETQPEILKLLRSGSLPEELRPHTDLARLNDLLDGRLPTAIAGADPQGEAYRGLILAACRCYHALMPFLFEAIDDETELLLPDDLLTATSVAEGFRTEITDDDCSEVEILGWLYQFYISEKKDAVMARKKAVPSEDIPAVTQLFTPHWIVRYLVENSLGRLWLRSRPHSRLKEHMPYYVADAPSKDEGGIMKDEVNSTSEPSSFILHPSSLTVETPEEIRLLDPACGSGHMLTYAFDLLVKIYEEEGHAPSEIPEKILTHNLFGLEICPRAAQLAQFALVCKAREQSRTAFRRPVQPQVMCLRDVVLTPEDMQAWSAATGVKLGQEELAQIHQFRENTETFGALIQPVLDGEKLAALVAKIGEQAPAGDLLVQNTHRKLHLVLDQAEMLTQRYQVVVANPPYLGKGAMDGCLREFGESAAAEYSGDTYSLFIWRATQQAVVNGYVGMVTMQSWMFISTFDRMRSHLFSNCQFQSVAHLGARGFDTISGEIVQTVAFVIVNRKPRSADTVFINLTLGRSEKEKAKLFLDQNVKNTRRIASLSAIPSWPMAYWIADRLLALFGGLDGVGEQTYSSSANVTGDNNRFLRQGWEVNASTLTRSAPFSWLPCAKGGEKRKWFGNLDMVILWTEEIHDYYRRTKVCRVVQRENWGKQGITWSRIASAQSVAFRVLPEWATFETAGMTIFPEGDRRDDRDYLMGLLNSKIASQILRLLNPTLTLQMRDVLAVPARRPTGDQFEDSIVRVVSEATSVARADWDNFETSWDFRDLPLLRSGDWEVEPDRPGGAWKGRTLAESWEHYATYCTTAIRRMQELETENNRLWIDAYGLQDELDPAVSDDEITLARADAKKDMAAFLSYAVGCMMGRYSLNHPGLILADAGDTVEHYLAKVGKPLDELSFPPDEDAIIPVLEGEWFGDDIVARTREFLRVTFGEATLHENLRFIEQSLGKSLEKYFLTDFYKDHLQTYKKRPIYWLFQSPKKGFSALVYLHRYTRDTVNTLLNGYLRDYLKKLESRIAHLIQVEATSTVTREKTAARKESDKLKKALKDCQQWERDVILPLAQQRLAIDLDDGVKSNYPKFEGAVQTIPGLKKED